MFTLINSIDEVILIDGKSLIIQRILRNYSFQIQCILTSLSFFYIKINKIMKFGKVRVKTKNTFCYEKNMKWS